MAESRKLVEIEATGLDEAGSGVGQSIGLPGDPSGPRTVHVPDLLPGERAEVAVTHQSPHKPEAWATIVRRVGEPSPARTTPACPAFGRCGGCAWQHLAYPAQLAEKRARVVRALAPLIGADAVEAAVAPVTPSPSELGYRHKGKYVAGWISGRLGLGAYAPRSHTLVDTGGCRVVAPLVDELRGRACAAAGSAGLAPWVENQRSGDLRYVIVRATRDERALVVLVVRSAADEARVAAVARAIAGDPRVAGVLRMDNDRDDGALLDGTARVLAGDATVRDTVAGVAIELGAGEFAQVNPAQADAMYARVTALALDRASAGASPESPALRAADVYAGLGGITLALASSGAHVVAIERDPSAVASLTAAAAGAGLVDRVDARAGDAASLAHVGPLDVIVVNPPRKGLSVDVIAAVLASSARRFIYVSCGPESLARDLLLLRDGGFTIDTIEPFDLMPGTSQVETIVRLHR